MSKNKIVQTKFKPIELPSVQVSCPLTIKELKEILETYEMEENHIVCFKYEEVIIPISQAHMNTEGDLFILEP